MYNRSRGKAPSVGIQAPNSLLVQRINESRARRAQSAQSAQERPVDALPESSDDDDDDDDDKNNNGSSKAKDSGAATEDISDVSDDEPRGAIQSTNFDKTTSRPAAASRSLTSTLSLRRPGLVLAQDQRGRGTKRPRPDADANPRATGDAAAAKKSVDLAATTIDFGRASRAPRQGYGASRKPSSQAVKKVPAALHKSDESDESGGSSRSSRPSNKSRLKTKGSAMFKQPPAALTEDSPPRRARKRVDAKPAAFKHSKYTEDDAEDSEGEGDKPAKPTRPAKPEFKKVQYSMSSDEGAREERREKRKKKENEKKEKEKEEKKERNEMNEEKEEKKEKKRKKEKEKETETEKERERETEREDKKAKRKDESVNGKRKDEPVNKRKDESVNGRKKDRSFKNKSAGIYGRRREDETSENRERVEAPRAVFRMPAIDSEPGSIDAAVFSDGELVRLGLQAPGATTDTTDTKADEGGEGAAPPPPLPVCPLCKKTVDDETVRALLPGHYLLTRPGVVRLAQLTFDEKVMFCAGHKQQASRHAWTARGYPAIDWEALPARLEQHYGHVRGVLLGGASEYRDGYAGSGSRQAVEAAVLVPGYYGRRGQQVLAAAIIQRLSGVLRQRAIEDPVVAARGMAPYVQAVLVPELAVQLIREDMGGLGRVTAAEGRRILGESAAIGEAVMEEEGDVVAEESGSEGGSGSEGYEYDSDTV